MQCGSQIFRSQRLASFMLSSLATKSRTASGAWMMIASRQWRILLCLLTLRICKDAFRLVCIFSEFIPDYATKSAELYNMIKPTFNWDLSTWKEDYVTDFENFKNAFAEWVAWYFPDWSLPWILRMDASDIAVCNALLMVERANGRDVLSL
jgi:hypothetical protein